MNGGEAGPPPPDGGNPFPATAVAPVLDLDEELPTVPTRAVHEVTEQLDAYLGQDPPGGRRRGAVVAIVGDYGTGKTHLVSHLLQEVHRRPAGDVRHLYIDAQVGSFYELYQRGFLGRLEPADVLRYVREYYAHIVADSLRETSFPAEIADRLRDGGLDPQRFVQQFGLTDETFLERLRERLRGVTDNPEFSTALMLLLRGGFDREVWEWFKGETPDPRLAERGIVGSLRSEAGALQAMGVFALLFTGHAHRFVLVIDELERVLAVPGGAARTATDAFKRLLAMAAESGTFLVLAGLPDFLKVLREDARARIGPVVHTCDLEPAEVREYVLGRLRAAGHDRGLHPFTEGVVDYLTWLAGGNARRVIQLCHSAYSLAEGDRTITEATVRQAAREHFQVLDLDDVRAEARRVLDAGARRYRMWHRLGGEAGPTVDFWIPVRDDGAGCAVVLTDSVLDGGRGEELARVARQVDEATPQSGTLLVVNGYIAPTLLPGLRQAFTDEPLTYAATAFAGAFGAALDGMTNRLRAKDDLAFVAETVARMAEVQTNTQRFVEQLAVKVESVRSASDQQFTVIQQELESLSGRTPAPGAPPSAVLRRRSPAGRPLPTHVERLFNDALGGLEGLGDVDAALRGTFGADRGRVGRTLMHRLSERQAFDAVGVASLVRTAVEAFRDAVRRWYAALPADRRQGGLAAGERAELAALCRSYDSVFEYLPLFRLDHLTGLAVRPAQPDERRTDNLLDRVTLPLRSADIRASLDKLSTQVQRTLLSEFSTPDAL